MRVQTIDLKLMSVKFMSKKYRKSFFDLKRSNALKSIISIVLDISIIVVAYFLLFESLIFMPVSLIVIGSRQRAISNLTHDASHVNLFSSRFLNDALANVFCAFPMFETISFYRGNHHKHHQFLGDIKRDPDSVSHLMYGYDDSNPWKGNPFKNFYRLIFNLQSLKSSLLGSLLNISFKEIIMVLSWWISMGLLLISCFGVQPTLLILCTWFLSKMTTYHLIRIVAEFLDHSGLRNEGIVNFSRNLPHDGFLRYIFHPNCDTFHLVHHLYPKIPHYNLREANKYINSNVDYLAAHHCDSYFFGKHSALDCWVGKCEGNIK